MESRIVYFDKPGRANTDTTLQAARTRADELGIRQMTVATTHGYTALRAREILDGLDVKITAVSICAAFDEKGWTLTAAERERLERDGIRVVTSVHALGDDVSDALVKTAPGVIVRETLYTFCQGMKVAVEVALMAADAGLLAMQEEVISVAGTEEGADTAVILKPAYTRQFKKLRVREILAKPR